MPYSGAYKSAMLLAWDPSICGKTELCLTCSTARSVSNLLAFWLHLQTKGLVIWPSPKVGQVLK